MFSKGKSDAPISKIYYALKGRRKRGKKRTIILSELKEVRFKKDTMLKDCCKIDIEKNEN